MSLKEWETSKLDIEPGVTLSVLTNEGYLLSTSTQVLEHALSIVHRYYEVFAGKYSEMNMCQCFYDLLYSSYKLQRMAIVQGRMCVGKV